MLRRVCVFCGSSSGVHPVYADAARDFGRLLTERGIGLVYGGSNRGLMGVLANACLEGGGEVIGVIPRALVEKEVAHTGLADLRVVASMHERKALMADLADGFVAMPGGYGTWDEFCEVLTWSQLGLHAKPCAVLNVNGYYDPFLAMADQAVREGFVRSAHRDMLLTDDDPGRLLERMMACGVPTATAKWVEPALR